MNYKITLHKDDVDTKDIQYLRKISNIPISAIKTDLSGDGLDIVLNYRNELDEQEYEEWVHSSIGLFTDLVNRFPNNRISYGDEVKEWEEIEFDYFCNFLKSSIDSWNQEHD